MTYTEVESLPLVLKGKSN